MHEAVIVDAVRTPGGKRNGRLSSWHPASLAAHVLDALAARSQLLYHGSRMGLSEPEIDTLFDEGMVLADRIGEPGLRVTFVLLAWLAMVQTGQSQKARALAR